VFDSWELAKAYQDHATIELASGPHKIVVEDVQRSPSDGRLRLAIADQPKLVSDAAKRLAAKADAVVVAVGFNRDSEGEGADRTFSLPNVKVGLKPGETQHVTVPLGTRSFAYYDANSGVWRAAAGTYKVLVGKSSEEIELSGEIKLARTVTEKP
jgi:hypothetical protein